ncbi:MAG: hydratase [Treponema sp.]|jgi:aconitate hydratase|nr:hydratase [Treponema sp.]
MIKVQKSAFYLSKGRELIEDTPDNQQKLKGISANVSPDTARRGTMSGQILLAHNSKSDPQQANSPGNIPLDLNINFDVLASHDITYVNIIQSAKASGLEDFPVPYVLTNCHNSLCAVGGTINADDHLFGLSAAQRYGGIFVPPHLAVIHSYIRENMAVPGKMILGSDSHTRYGSLGTMGVGEGGGELVKQLLRQSYEVAYPRVIAVYLTGKPRLGVGPQDVALALIGAVFKDGFAKNAVLEFVGDGIAYLSPDYRASIDIMTTETACWSSIWETDDKIAQYMGIHYRDEEYKRISPGDLAYYDGLIFVDLAEIKPMIALPFHPSNVFELDTFLQTPGDIFRQVEKDAAELIENPNLRINLTANVSGKKVRVDQAVIAGCAGGTYDNIMAVRSVIGAHSCSGGKGNEGFSFSVYPSSQPIILELAENGALSSLIGQGVIVRSAFCGPCFGAGDVPANNSLSIRHTTRNFPNREGSKPNEGQIASVCLMDSRSIAATALNGGYLTSAEPLARNETTTSYHFGAAPYLSKVYNGVGKPDKSVELRYGPNIVDWPSMESLGNDLLLKIVSYINDPVTTTDELIPSGETSSYRSNPIGLAEFTLSRKDSAYVGKAKAVREAANALRIGSANTLNHLPELPSVLSVIKEKLNFQGENLQLASAIFAHKPGDGSAREQAASCQRVLGGLANFANEYATKRYRSNLINWGILPFIIEGEPPFKNGDYIFIPGLAKAIKEAAEMTAYVIRETGGEAVLFSLKVPELNAGEKDLILAGSLINLNRKK